MDYWLLLDASQTPGPTFNDGPPDPHPRSGPDALSGVAKRLQAAIRLPNTRGSGLNVGAGAGDQTYDTISCPEWVHYSSPIYDQPHTVGCGVYISVEIRSVFLQRATIQREKSASDARNRGRWVHWCDMKEKSFSPLGTSCWGCGLYFGQGCKSAMRLEPKYLSDNEKHEKHTRNTRETHEKHFTFQAELDEKN